MISILIGVLSYDIGTILGVCLVDLVVFWFIQDVTRMKHTIPRNDPVTGRLRYFSRSRANTSASISLPGWRKAKVESSDSTQLSICVSPD